MCKAYESVVSDVPRESALGKLVDNSLDELSMNSDTPYRLLDICILLSAFRFAQDLYAFGVYCRLSMSSKNKDKGDDKPKLDKRAFKRAMKDIEDNSELYDSFAGKH